MFKKVITGDELSVEEKYKTRYTIKPFCKFIWGTNNLPRIDKIADEGFYRRLCIIPFDRHITDEEEKGFDKRNILSQEALDYLANIALREYLKIKDTHILANQAETEEKLELYKKSNDSVEDFLEDKDIINNIFSMDNKILKTIFYKNYTEWCKKNSFFVKKKKEFYDAVLNNIDYIECTMNGRDFFKNINKNEFNYAERRRTF